MDWGVFKKGVFLVNVLAIIYDPKVRKVLIGRRENDRWIKELSWVFPGGRPDYKNDLEDNVMEIVKEKTGLMVKNPKIIFSKTYPEKREFLSIYYYCEPENAGKEEISEELVELMWVKPSDVVNHFTTSLHPKLLKFLKTLD